MGVKVEIVNAFVDGDAGGNPAGVVLEAEGLSRERKLEIARRVGLSETAFVSASAVATFKLEFFTPTRQIAHCGHATIATFCRMRELGMIADGTLSKETVAGPREITVQGETTWMQQMAPTFGEVQMESELGRRALAALRVSPAALMSGIVPMVVNTGNAFLVVPMRDTQSLASLQPDMLLISQISDELDLIGYYAFALNAKRPGRDATTRMFAPRYGIDEESASGMAAGPLACYLHNQGRVVNKALEIEQGWFMPVPSPSIIQVNLDMQDGIITSVMAGGKARSVSCVTL